MDPLTAEMWPKSGVTLSNIALLHTSFLRQDKTREHSDGRIYYQFEVIVVAPESVMARIHSVVYRLEDAWPAKLRTQEISDRKSRFKMKELANGTSIVCADVNSWTPRSRCISIGSSISVLMARGCSQLLHKHAGRERGGGPQR